MIPSCSWLARATRHRERRSTVTADCIGARQPPLRSCKEWNKGRKCSREIMCHDHVSWSCIICHDHVSCCLQLGIDLNREYSQVTYLLSILLLSFPPRWRKFDKSKIENSENNALPASSFVFSFLRFYRSNFQGWGWEEKAEVQQQWRRILPECHCRLLSNIWKSLSPWLPSFVVCSYAVQILCVFAMCA